MPDRVVVAGEDEESDHSAGEEGGEAGEAHVAQPESAQAQGLPAGGSAPLGKVPLTQIQLKLGEPLRAARSADMSCALTSAQRRGWSCWTAE